jgi:hypothetical protein
MKGVLTYNPQRQIPFNLIELFDTTPLNKQGCKNAQRITDTHVA